MNIVIQKILYSLPVLGAALSIYYVSSLPQIPYIHSTCAWYDKVLHIIAYFIFGISLFLAFVPYKKTSLKKKLIISIIIGAFYGATDEYHQYFVIGRSSEIADLIADIIGICLSSIFMIVYHKYQNRNIK
jgi:VanZ family protein